MYTFINQFNRINCGRDMVSVSHTLLSSELHSGAKTTDFDGLTVLPNELQLYPKATNPQLILEKQFID